MELTAEQVDMAAVECGAKRCLHYTYKITSLTQPDLLFAERLSEGRWRLTPAGCFVAQDKLRISLAIATDGKADAGIDVDGAMVWCGECPDAATAIHSALARIHEQRTQDD